MTVEESANMLRASWITV